MCNLKTLRENKQHSLYEFELGHNATEATKNICVKSEGTVDHSTVTRWIKKFYLGWMNPNDQVQSGKLKLWILRLCSKP